MLFSHGNHIPLEIRDAATFLFCAPHCLRHVDEAGHAVTMANMLQVEHCLSLCQRRIEQCLAGTFHWPSTAAICQQYFTLMQHWKGLIAALPADRDEGSAMITPTLRRPVNWQLLWRLGCSVVFNQRQHTGPGHFCRALRGQTPSLSQLAVWWY